MRFKLLAVALMIGAVAILLSPGYGQQPQRYGMQKKGKGGGKNFWDPNVMFDNWAKGRDFFLVSDTGPLQERLADYAARMGITDGKITRPQYLAISEQMRADFGKGKGKGMMPGGGGATPGAGPATPALDVNQRAELDFKLKDINGDGFLNSDEMPGSLRDDLAKWDKNKDNLIDVEEYKAFYAAREQDRSERAAQRAAMIQGGIDDDWEKRPTVYRFGKLPPNIPKWFIELDKDQDGQVSLAEWRRGNKEMDEFAKYDRNGDGLLTPEEVMRVEMLAKAGATGDESPSVVQGIVNPPPNAAANPYKMKGPPGGGDYKKKKGRPGG